MKHYSVMLTEVIESLNIKPDGIYVDATLGYAGMSKEILKRLNDNGKLIAIDQDEEAINYSKDVLSKISNNFEIIKANFKDLKQELEKRNVTKIDGIIFDLGFSSPQIDDSSRGFSFMSDGPLDMRMNLDSKVKAYDIVNFKSDYFYRYGEEKLSRLISKKIVEERSKKPIETTLELVSVIESAVGAKNFYNYHPERKIFQALRIAVNDELNVLESVLPDAIDLLNKGGRMSVITFHSLEDKIVKKIFKENSEIDEIVKGMPNIPLEYLPKVKLVTKKPILPSTKELEENSKSHSAKLRVIERL